MFFGCLLILFISGRSGYRRRAFRYIFARSPRFLLVGLAETPVTSTGSVTRSQIPLPLEAPKGCRSNP